MYEHQCLACGNIFYSHTDKPVSCPVCEIKYQETPSEQHPGLFARVNITRNYVD